MCYLVYSGNHAKQFTSSTCTKYNIFHNFWHDLFRLVPNKSCVLVIHFHVRRIKRSTQVNSIIWLNKGFHQMWSSCTVGPTSLWSRRAVTGSTITINLKKPSAIKMYRNDSFRHGNTKNIKNFTTIIITCHMTSCEWWRSNGWSTPPPLISWHMTNCDKNCEIFCVPNIAPLVIGPLYHCISVIAVGGKSRKGPLMGFACVNKYALFAARGRNIYKSARNASVWDNKT